MADELLIIGAGPSGLALSYAYPGRSRILERSDGVGGLCRSTDLDGGMFDLGGHSFHSPHPEVRELVRRLLHERWHVQQRDARVYFGGALIGYPFQDHLHEIAEPAISEACKTAWNRNAASDRARDFEDWIVKRFGTGIARHFMLPYNRKLWARDLRRMSCEWVGERIAQSEAGPGDERRRRPLDANSQVGYPTEGGFDEIFRTLAMHCGPIEFGQDVRRIDPVARTVEAADGTVWRWERLVSTMPLPHLVRALCGCPEDLIAQADRLEYVSLKILILLVNEPLGQAPQRVYIADPDVPPHKIAFNHTSSPNLRQRPVHAIVGEVSYSNEKPPAPDEQLVSATVDWLLATELITGRSSICGTKVIDVRFGYPVYTRERHNIVEKVRTHLAELDIQTIGRFGAWEYVNSDECIWQGLRLAKTLAKSAWQID